MKKRFDILKTGFFGWNNIKWAIKEIVRMYSNKESFFSYKRFQTGLAFFLFTQGAAYVLYNFVKTPDEFLIWCIPVLLVCGYTLNKTQQEKTELLNKEE